MPHDDIVKMVCMGADAMGKDCWLWKAQERCLSRICLVAHIDTVWDTERKGKSPQVYHDAVKRVWFAPLGLGADDRAGVWAALDIRRVTGCAVLLTDGEETGGRGAREAIRVLADELCEFHAFIEIDRRGYGQAVYYHKVPEEWKAWIASYGFKEEHGTFSDVSVLGPAFERPTVNLSAGYAFEHRQNEYLVEAALRFTRDKVLQMVISRRGAEFLGPHALIVEKERVEQEERDRSAAESRKKWESYDRLNSQYNYGSGKYSSDWYKGRRWVDGQWQEGHWEGNTWIPKEDEEVMEARAALTENEELAAYYRALENDPDPPDVVTKAPEPGNGKGKGRKHRQAGFHRLRDGSEVPALAVVNPDTLNKLSKLDKPNTAFMSPEQAAAYERDNPRKNTPLLPPRFGPERSSFVEPSLPPLLMPPPSRPEPGTLFGPNGKAEFLSATSNERKVLDPPRTPPAAVTEEEEPDVEIEDLETTLLEEMAACAVAEHDTLPPPPMPTTTSSTSASGELGGVIPDNGPKN
jgi:hypothetical protein